MLRRTPLKRRGKQSLRESKVSPEHERLLQIFWAKANWWRREGFPSLIVKMLREYESIEGKKVASRHNFDRIKHRFKIKGKPCLCCDQEAVVRHHILPLGKGGPNCALNVAPLCDDHHAEIHPWLAKDDK